MDIHRIKTTPRTKRRTKIMTIRITPEISEWMKKNHYSPTKIFYEALRELKCPMVKK